MARRNSSTEGAIEVDISNYWVGDEIFLFYCVDYAITLYYLTKYNGVITMERVKGWTDLIYYSAYLKDDHVTVSSNELIYSGIAIFLQWDNIPAETIKQMFLQCSVTKLKSYYSSTLTNTASTLRVATADISAKNGICFAAFADLPSGGTASGVWGVTSTSAPSTAIKTYRSSEGMINRSPLMTSGSYQLPTADGTNTARVRSYTLMNFEETW